MESVQQQHHESTAQTEILSGIVSRVTFHSAETGWSVLRVSPLGRSFHDNQLTVTIHQCKVFAGATFDFEGYWVDHPQFGRQFKALRATEKKPATTAALEKYLGSGLIFGVGPKTAKKIVAQFKDQTLDIFEKNISRLTEVTGIAEAKLKQIKEAWEEHREIRNVMIFLQGHGISTLFAVKIYKVYGQDAIKIVRENPYRLAKDFYGIGFFSADKVALSLGFKADGCERKIAGIRHILNAAREEGHCFLLLPQITDALNDLLNLVTLVESKDLLPILLEMEKNNELKTRTTDIGEKYFYAKSLFFDEEEVRKNIRQLLNHNRIVDVERVRDWIDRYCELKQLALSEEQRQSVAGIVGEGFSVLTGGPGCGKTTTTQVLVRLLKAMNKKVILAAPTGRAAQRMTEVIGEESKTIHRLLQFDPSKNGFKKNKEDPLEGDFFIIDECSMLDINLTASLLKAIPEKAQVVFIGDADQLPSVGPGYVLNDIIASSVVKVFRLTQIFRQAAQSLIIQAAHKINRGELPLLESPFKDKNFWYTHDCLFIDSEEMTKEQALFVYRIRKKFMETGDFPLLEETDPQTGEDDLLIPRKFQHVPLEQLLSSQSVVEELKLLLKKISPYSTLNYGLTAVETLKKLVVESIPKYLGTGKEIQVLSPMVRGSLGTANLNKVLQETLNPWSQTKGEIRLQSEKVLREGDRIIQTRNNYDLGVFNGDIGLISKVDAISMECLIQFDLKASPEKRREVMYSKENLLEIDLAYAITIHKSQGSEFDVVIIPLLTQHFKMLFRNLVYTGLTRAKKCAILLGQRKAFALAVRNADSRKRQTALEKILQ